MKKLLMLFVSAMLLSIAGYSLTPITGTMGACVGDSTYLYGDSTVRTPVWSTSNASIASIEASTGIVTAISAGTCTISFTDGTSTVTATFTVYSAPAAITGTPSSICPGSSVTLSSTTTGGTWSTITPSVATVNATTGVVTTLSAGTAIVYYSVGTGCSVSTSFYVGSGTLTDSIIGATNVCVGSSSTYTVATTGGTWTSSNPSIASINPTTGVLTGISSGTVTLSYTISTSCGSSSVYTYVNVISTASAGTISGTTTLFAGSTTTLYATVMGGSWSTSSASIASVTPSGVVYGLSAGTAIITYSVTACGTTAVTTATITVNSFTGISGWVFFDSGSYYGNVKIWLIKYNASTSMLTAVDSTTIYAAGDSVYYSFAAATTDTYRVKAAAIDTSRTIFGYIPTYHDTSFYWRSANTFVHTSGTGDYRKNIHMAYGAVTTGPGFIAGNVTAGANKGSADGIPAVNMTMVLLNTSTGRVVAQTVTDASGNYSFSSLPVGTSYNVFPEAINYITFPYNGISLTTATPSKTASFLQKTISKTINPIMVNVAEINNAAASLNVFPNPSSTELTVSWVTFNSENANITLSELTGRVVYTSSLKLVEGAGATKINVSSLPAGTYILNLKSATLNNNQKVQVTH